MRPSTGSATTSAASSVCSGAPTQGIPTSDVEAFEEALSTAGVRHEIQIYEGTPHSFFDRAYDEFADDCDDAWRRIERFIDANS